MSTRLTGLVFFICLFLASERPALAYTDPGSGALLWQAMLAAVVGVSFHIRRFIGWYRKKREGGEANGTGKN